MDESFRKKVVEALQNEELLEQISGMSGSEIRDTACKLGVMIPSDKPSDEVSSEIKSRINEIKGFTGSQLEDFVKKVLS